MPGFWLRVGLSIHGAALSEGAHWYASGGRDWESPHFERKITMFFDTFQALCEEKGVSCTRAAKEMGLSNSITTKWRKTGATPGGETLEKVAAYFGVSTDYLLGKEKLPAPEGGQDVIDDIDIAFYGQYRQLDEDAKQTIRDMVAVMRKRKGNV